MAPDTWPLTPDTWHLTPGTWHLTPGIWPLAAEWFPPGVSGAATGSLVTLQFGFIFLAVQVGVVVGRG